MSGTEGTPAVHGRADVNVETASRTALVRRARRINRELAPMYPDAHTELNFTTPLELLVATILSAQSTDKRVNQVTPVLFAPLPHRGRLRRGRPGGARDDHPVDRVLPGQDRRAHRDRRRPLCDRFGGEVPARLARPGHAARASAARRPTWCSATRSACPASPWTRTSAGWPGGSAGPSRRPGQGRAGRGRAVPAPDWTMLSHRLIWHGRRRLPRPPTRPAAPARWPGCARPTASARPTRRWRARW